MVTLVVTVVIASVAIPSFSTMLSRSRLRAAVEQLRADLTLARTEALRRNEVVFASFTRSADGSWCYGLSLDAACDCTAVAGANVCFLDRDAANNPLRRVVSSGEYRGVTMDAAVAALSFGPVRPTLSTRSITLTAAGRKARVITANMGRVRVCSPTGDAYLYYYDACT